MLLVGKFIIVFPAKTSRYPRSLNSRTYPNDKFFIEIVLSHFELPPTQKGNSLIL